MGREMGGRFKREETYVHLWLIHVDTWQKTTKFGKTMILLFFFCSAYRVIINIFLNSIYMC